MSHPDTTKTFFRVWQAPSSLHQLHEYEGNQPTCQIQCKDRTESLMEVFKAKIALTLLSQYVTNTGFAFAMLSFTGAALISVLNPR